MTKETIFTEEDERLVREIKVYQHKEKLGSFAEAVKELCEKGIFYSLSTRKIDNNVIILDRE